MANNLHGNLPKEQWITREMEVKNLQLLLLKLKQLLWEKKKKKKDSQCISQHSETETGKLLRSRTVKATWWSLKKQQKMTSSGEGMGKMSLIHCWDVHLHNHGKQHEGSSKKAIKRNVLWSRNPIPEEVSILYLVGFCFCHFIYLFIFETKSHYLALASLPLTM